MEVVSITVDEYLGFKYIVPTRLASHPAPYIKVLAKTGKKEITSVAFILLRTKEIQFYDGVPSTIVNQRDVIAVWINKNINLAKKLWNEQNEVKV